MVSPFYSRGYFHLIQYFQLFTGNTIFEFRAKKRLSFYADHDGIDDFIQSHKKLFPVSLGSAKMLILFAKAQLWEEQCWVERWLVFDRQPLIVNL